MDTIIIRKKAYISGQVNSNFIRLHSRKTYKKKDTIICDLGWKKTLSLLLGEKIDTDELSTSALYKSYESLLSSNDRENADFLKAYKINEHFAISLDANIFLFHLIPKGDVYSDIVPWYCADGQVYLGDTWWEQDDEILENVQKLSVIDFLEQYKGWCFPNKKLF